MARKLFLIMTILSAAVLLIAGNFFTINEQTTGEIANRLPILFVPAGYVYLIWGVIFVSLLYWTVQSSSSDRHITRKTILLLCTGLLTISWVLCWHYGCFVWTVAMKAISLILLLCIYYSFSNRESTFSGRIPFSLFIGWTFFSLLLNTVYALLLHEWSGFGLSDPLWAVIFLTVSAAFALHFLYHHRDYWMTGVFVWCLIGVAVKNGTDELFISAAALFLTAVLVVFMFIMKPRRETGAVEAVAEKLVLKQKNAQN